ncbi:hypothetical protein [Brevibacillus gelatini]
MRTVRAWLTVAVVAIGVAFLTGGCMREPESKQPDSGEVQPFLTIATGGSFRPLRPHRGSVGQGVS